MSSYDSTDFLVCPVFKNELLCFSYTHVPYHLYLNQNVFNHSPNLFINPFRRLLATIISDLPKSWFKSAPIGHPHRSTLIGNSWVVNLAFVSMRFPNALRFWREHWTMT